MRLERDQISDIFPALATPTGGNGQIGVEALRRLVGHVLDIGRDLLPLRPPGPATVAKLEAAIAQMRRANILEAPPKAAAGRD